MKIISADDHLAETPDLWEKRLPKGLREKGPRFVQLPGGGEGWMMPGAPAPRPLGLDVMAGRKYEDYQAVGIRWEDVRDEALVVDERFCRGDWSVTKTQESSGTISVDPSVIARIRRLKSLEVEVNWAAAV